MDFVLEEGGGRVAGVEVKLARTLSQADFRGLRSLAEDAGSRFAGGVVLYTGDQTKSFGKQMWAMPLSNLWLE